MLLLTCPICGISADETEFSCGGLIGTPRKGAPRYPRTIVREHWLCEAGCGSWFGIARHIGNQRIAAIWRPGEEPDFGKDAS